MEVNQVNHQLQLELPILSTPYRFGETDMEVNQVNHQLQLELPILSTPYFTLSIGTLCLYTPLKIRS